MDIHHFYKLSRKQIAQSLREFIDEDFFNQYPRLKNKLSIIITGSVAYADYDEYSDIDVEFACLSEQICKQVNQIIKDYKKTIILRKIPIQFHAPKNIQELTRAIIKNWGEDSTMREYSQALIVVDFQNKFKQFQRKLSYYPKSILKEKINWLFSEAIFTFAERYQPAEKRGNLHFATTNKLHIIKLLGNALLMANKQWPSFEKHLYPKLKETLSPKHTVIKLINKLIIEADSGKAEKLLTQLISIVEEQLIVKKMIQKKPTNYWISLRPKYKVKGI